MKSACVLVLAFLVLVSPTPGFGSGTAPFVVEVIDHVDEVSLGLPAVCDVKVRNISGIAQDVVAMELIQRFENWPNDVKERDLPGHSHWDSPSELPRVFYKPEVGFEVPSDWSQVRERSFRLPGPGRYSFRYVIRMGPTPVRVKKMFNAPEEHWIGEVSSKLISVVVRKPEGLDAEAFHAVCALAPEKLVSKIPPADCYRMVWHPGKPTVARQLLLTEYSDSTYAAYEIYRHFNNGYTGVDSAVYNRYASAEGLRLTKNHCACDSEGNPRPELEKWPELKGRSYLKCRDNWFRIALKNHPDVWFAAEMRFILAGDAYLLGEKDQCRKMLTDLAKQGRPYVAMKAGELLHDMQSKNMLPGGPKELGAAPAPAQAEGKAAQ